MVQEELTNPNRVSEKLKNLERYLPEQDSKTYSFAEYLGSRLISSYYIPVDVFISEYFFAVQDLRKGKDYNTDLKINHELTAKPHEFYIQLRSKMLLVIEAVYGTEIKQEVIERYRPFGGIEVLIGSRD